MPNQNQKPPYQVLYDEFINNYKRSTVDGEQVGEMIAKMVQFYSDINLGVATAEVAYGRKAVEQELQLDPTSGKPISSAKAKVLTDGSDESVDLIIKKAHLGNIEQQVNALKYLQKGVLNEMNKAGLL